jgi:ABC-2 type transport system permease protein
MIPQLRSELRKMRTTRTNLGLLLGLIAVVLFTALISTLTVDVQALDELVNQKELLANGTVGAVFAALIGIMAMTSEFRHGTIRATFVFTPLRGRVVAAKVLASLLVGVGFGVLGETLAFGTGYAVIRGRGVDLLLTGSDIRLLFLGTIGMSALWAALGVGLGAVLRNQVLAVIGLILWALVVEILLFQFVPEVARYAPGAAGTAMTGGTAGDQSVDLLSAPVGALLLAAYSAVLVLAGALVTSRRDVG